MRIPKGRAAKGVCVAAALGAVALGANGLAQAGGRPPGGSGHRARAAATTPRVLLVGSYAGIPGQYSSIQSAVDAAQPGDWILVGPGDYHEQADRRANRGPKAARAPAGVVISTPGIHLRGMDRNAVVVDGTKPGSPQCSRNQTQQDFGVPGSDGKPLGRNGILVTKTNGVSVENLTACNFLNGSGSAGNEIWWNGGDGGGQIGLRNFYGSYLTATSTYYDPSHPDTAASYGIFSSNADGGRWDVMYASNMSDSNFYVGACQQVCNQTINQVHSQYSAQGYSGTNAGGTVIIENSEFDHNRGGFTAGALNNDDWPAPQDGACPTGTSPITHTYQCWVFQNNYVHDNNNPNTPGVGIASAVPVGVGVLLYGGRDNAIINNRFENNGAWGVIAFTFPDNETPPDDVVAAGYDCRGGIGTGQHGGVCTFDDWGNAIGQNRFRNNGFFKSQAGPGGNASDADFGEITSTTAPTNCFYGNVEEGGGSVTSSPPGLEQLKPTCNRQNVPPDPNPAMTNDLACTTQAFGTPCPPNEYSPPSTGVQMPPLPADLPTMPDPCAGVPDNPWCARGLGLPGGGVGNSVNGGPGAGRCVSGRHLVIHIRRRGLRRAEVFVNGRRVRVLRGRRLRARVNLRGLPAGTVNVRIVGIRRNGKRVTQARTYHTCTARSHRKARRGRRARRRGR